MKKEIVWPHGHQAAAMICIMLDAEFIWLGMDPEKYDTPKHRSMGEYGPRRGSQSSRLYINLIKNGKLFSEVDAYITGDMDPGLFIFSGKLSEGVAIEEAEAAIQNEIDHFIEDPISERELQKVINKTEARISYSEINYQGKSANLAFFDYLGDVNLINSESTRYAEVSLDSIKQTARELFSAKNCSTLWYLKDK